VARNVKYMNAAQSSHIVRVNGMTFPPMPNCLRLSFIESGECRSQASRPWYSIGYRSHNNQVVLCAFRHYSVSVSSRPKLRLSSPTEHNNINPEYTLSVVGRKYPTNSIVSAEEPFVFEKEEIFKAENDCVKLKKKTFTVGCAIEIV